MAYVVLGTLGLVVGFLGLLAWAGDDRWKESEKGWRDRRHDED